MCNCRYLVMMANGVMEHAILKDHQYVNYKLKHIILLPVNKSLNDY